MPRFVRSSGGVDIAAYELGGAGRDLLFAHATGFCGAVWRPVAERLEGFRCVALDFRAHGRSGRPEDGDLDWEGTADDVLAVVDGLGLVEPAGAGHSMGGAALLLAELRRPGTFRSLWTYEPVVMPPEVVDTASDASGHPLAAAAARRRDRFPSRQTARDNFAGKPPMSTFHPDALEAYLDGGFATDPDGSVHLRCRPDDESRLYRMGLRHDAARRLGGVRCPVTVVVGRPDPGPPEFAPAVARGLPAGRLEEHPELGHFGPMEDPDRVASSITAAVG